MIAWYLGNLIVLWAAVPLCLLCLAGLTPNSRRYDCIITVYLLASSVAVLLLDYLIN